VVHELLEELRSLDPRDPGRWPLAGAGRAVRLCFLVLAFMGCIYFFVWQGAGPQLQARGQEHGAALRIPRQARQGDQPEIYKQQLADIEKSFGAMLRQLPSKTEVPNLLVDISQTGLAAALQRSCSSRSPR
jgi:type IV pilus assembly protein PilO